MSKPTIWITGASSGIGEALVYAYARKGYNLILSARSEDKLNQIKKVAGNGKSIVVLPLDLTKQESFREKTQAAIAAFGSIDILLNNGGISQRSLAKDTSLEVDRKLMEVNYFGTVALTKALLPHFIENKRGHFGVVSSLVGKFGSPYRTSYAASKHALHGFFDSLRAEHHGDNIFVTMICPGFVKTNVSINALTGDGTPLNQMDEAQDKGMSPQVCADKILKGMESKKEEILIGGKEKYAVYFKRLLPSLFSKILRKAKVR